MLYSNGVRECELKAITIGFGVAFCKQPSFRKRLWQIILKIIFMCNIHITIPYLDVRKLRKISVIFSKYECDK